MLPINELNININILNIILKLLTQLKSNIINNKKNL